MKRTAAALLLCALSAVAQQLKPALPPLVEKIEVNVVNVDVTVLDRSGKPVSDLTKDDFEIREDGVLQQITNFSVIRRETVVPAPEVEQPERRNSVVVLVYDPRLDVDYFALKILIRQAVDAIEKILDRSADATSWSVVRLTDGSHNLETILPFSTDHDAIRAALEAVRKSAPAPGKPAGVAFPGQRDVGAVLMPQSFREGVEAAQALQSDASFFSAVSATIRGMAWLSGQKSLLLVTPLIPGYAPPSDRAVIEARLHQQLVEEANAFNVKISVLNPAGISGDPWDTEGGVWLAAKTGGLYLGGNYPGESFTKFETARSNYYELGYHAARDDGRYHRIDVRIKRRGDYTIAHREGYERLSRDAAFERAILTPLGIASQKATLPLSLVVGDAKRKDAKLSVVPFRADIPLELVQMVGSRGRLHVYVSVFDDTGNPVTYLHTVEEIAAGKKVLLFTRALALKKGTYRIFVTVRDDVSGEVGVAEKEIEL